MNLFSEIEQRRAANAKKLATFGVNVSVTASGSVKVIRNGAAGTIYSVGYERRDGDGLMSVLRDQGVRTLADVRERPVSRKADFRAANLRAFCEAAGIEYEAWPMLGSTVDQREELHASGDFRGFAERFRKHALETMAHDLARLAESSQRMPTALLCYERAHEDCHRSVIADLIAERLNATIIAIT
jgi:uncharacterized protein (DUF488 family)